MITYFLGLPTGCCVFPFTYRGANYNHCTTDGGHPSHWCATELNDDGSMKRWQNCDQNCIGMYLFLFLQYKIFFCGIIV